MKTQLRLEAFYTFNEKFAKIRSKRIKKAVKGIRGNVSSDLIDETMEKTSKSRKKRRVSPAKPLDDVNQKPLSGTNEPVTNDECSSGQRSTKKLSSKRKHPAPSKDYKKEPVMQSRGRKTRKGLSGEGRIITARGRAARRGRNRENPDLDFAGSSGDGSNSDNEEMQVEEVQGSSGVRKSTRTRKAVKYTLDELEIDEPSKNSQHEMNSDYSEAVEEQLCTDHDAVEINTVRSLEKNEERVGDISPRDGSNAAYLEIGGGFCTDEVETEFETGHTSSARRDDPSFEEEFSKEYLRVGGGFCLEEDDTNEDPVKGALDETQDELDPSTSTPQGDRSTLAGPPHEGTKEADSHLVPATSLCAMLALRRKRKK